MLYSGGEDGSGFLDEEVVSMLSPERAEPAARYALWLDTDTDSFVTADGSFLLLRGEEGIYTVS